jgi:hypothetical protein
MSTRVLRLAAALVVALAVSPSAQAPAPAADPANPLLGTWRLNLTKSRYSPGPAPRGETRIYSQESDGLRGVILRHHADGLQERIEYRANYDQEYPVSGTTAYDAARFTKVNDYTSQAVLSHAGRVFGSALRVISNDGKTMTITFQRREVQEPVYNVAVYEKEAF